MAKPRLNPIRPPPAASSSSSASTTRHPNYPLNRSPRSRPSRSHILPLLAAISATPLSIYAYPLDPTQTSLPFLYPPFLYQPTPIAKRSVTPSTLDAGTPTSSQSPTPSSSCKYDRSDLPDKYVVGEDGLWHKTYWSLYGSANCMVSDPGLPFMLAKSSLLFLQRLHVFQQQTMTSVIQREASPLLPPILLMTLTSRPYRPVGLPLGSRVHPTVVPSSFSPYPWPLRCSSSS